ncbi:hypothetical protein [Luteimonas terrae]|uniref:AI-2E family transporter n=1 Tax=Luteimonas terrae TaxID=1530191 RepID=A0ABU1XUT9_9GAMM|nr:hypothetical protein [Luteimonas terrae]MDR7191901.1 hypothetical protein [Luteimonas terrae]
MPIAMTTPDPGSDLATRRRRARRTAVTVAVIAALVYIGFIARGVLLS